MSRFERIIDLAIPFVLIAMIAAYMAANERRNQAMHRNSLDDRARTAALLQQVERDMARFHGQSSGE